MKESFSHGISFRDAVIVWMRIASLSFGGPAGQIAVMHQILVEEKRWIGEQRFLHALNYCMLLPGPEAQQLATYIGWLLHGVRGGLVAGCLFVVPGFLAILVLSYIYAIFGNTGLVEGLFFGLKAAVLAIVLQALIRIGKRALNNHAMIAIASISFTAIFLFDVSFPLIVASAGLVGFLGARAGLQQFGSSGGHSLGTEKQVSDKDSALGKIIPPHARRGVVWALKLSLIMLLLWLAPLGLLVAILGPDNVFSQIGIFFSKMAVVTFGGAYAVLGYVAQEAVQNFGWLQPGEMLDGLGMAETTPGPLIQVVQFVGFMAAFREATGLDPLLAAKLAALLTTWVTFVPCFLWIFLGAPFVEMLRANDALSGALSAITAAVVGVILNLTIWFALHVLFSEQKAMSIGFVRVDLPLWSSLNFAALILTIATVLGIFVFRFRLLVVLFASVVLGSVWSLAVT